MARKERRAAQAMARKKENKTIQPSLPPGVRIVPSLLDEMLDGNEYQSIAGLHPSSTDLVPELRQAIKEIEQIRNRRCLCYVANVIKDVPDTVIHRADHLPFNEMVEKLPHSDDAVDIFLVTPGGSAEQISLFVDALRPRFNSVQFILPYIAMSAGTLWAFSGDKIWMDRNRAFIGPIDPQIHTAGGAFVPAQSILTLLRRIQDVGNQALQAGQNVPWAYVRLLDQMNQHQLGNAINSTDYIITIASEYLEAVAKPVLSSNRAKSRTN